MENRQTGGQNKRLEGSREHNPLKRFYESNGPDVKVRGPAALVAEKYLQLARDAQAADEPEAVVLDFVHPLRPGRDHVGGRRKARLNEVGRTTGGRCGAPQHGIYDAY
ncbi:MAG: DUF4167 domain-containing protein [Xanthobacteraceae bacterium]